MTVMYENHKLVYGLMCVAFYDVEDIKEYFNSFISFGRDRRATDPTVDSMVSEMERLSIGLDVQVGFFFYSSCRCFSTATIASQLHFLLLLFLLHASLSLAAVAAAALYSFVAVVAASFSVDALVAASFSVDALVAASFSVAIAAVFTLALFSVVAVDASVSLYFVVTVAAASFSFANDVSSADIVVVVVAAAAASVVFVAACSCS